eukprot:11223345-Lingulodinium_polyedra.AAC.1
MRPSAGVAAGTRSLACKRFAPRPFFFPHGVGFGARAPARRAERGGQSFRRFGIGRAAIGRRFPTASLEARPTPIG